MKTYLYIIKFNSLRFFAYPGVFISILIKRVLEVTFIVAFWNIATPGMHIQPLIAYFLIANGINEIIMGRSFELAGTLRNLIRTGEINQYIIKPVNLLSAIYSFCIGQKSINNLFSVCFILAGIFLVENSNIVSFIFFIVSLFFTILINFTLNLFVGTLTFYMSEVNAIRYVAQHTVRILGGYLIPIYFFPLYLQNLIKLSPFAYIISAPIEIININPVDIRILEILVYQIIWSVILMTITISFWNKSLKFYDAVGI